MENSKNTTKESNKNKNQTAFQRWVSNFWNYFENNRVARWLMYGVTSFASLFALKHFLYDRFLPMNQITQMIQQSKFSRVLMGNFLMICYVKNAGSADYGYYLSSLSHLQQSQVF